MNSNPGAELSPARAVKLENFFDLWADVAFESRPRHIEPVTSRNSSALDLEAPSLRDISWVRLRHLLRHRLISSKLALWSELASKFRVRDRRYEIFDLAAL